MTLLQIFIWAVIDSKKLSSPARQILLGAAEVFVSAASIWEAVFMSFPYPPAMRQESVNCHFTIGTRLIGC
jgi:hypothetical protein